MGGITVVDLLNEYKQWAAEGKIKFLRANSKKEVVSIIDNLIPIMEVEKSNPNQFKWYEAHKYGTELWQELAKAALNNIDPASKGNSTLIGFLSSATKFEELLYGLEFHYRDHTLHSLWVYLTGEYVLRNKLSDIHKHLNWYLFNDIKQDGDRYAYPKPLIKYSEKKKSQLIKEVKKKQDAIWCIMALCHDLGYSLAKLRELNERVKDVLIYFELPDFKHIGYSLDIEHQYLVSQFLELMAMDIRIVPSENYKELVDLKKKLDKLELDRLEFDKKLEEHTLIKCYRDDGTYWRLCQALEKKQHGILSSYLIYKILSIFADASVRGPAEEWGLEDEEAVENIIRGHILFSIAQHQFDFAYLNEFSSLADVLILADELEEFSRYGRDLSSRKYLPTMAKSDVSFQTYEENEQKYMTINISYEVHEDCSLIDFFIFKAERLCKFYSLIKEKEKNDFHIINEISMTAKKRDLAICIKLNIVPGENKVFLPKKKHTTLPSDIMKSGYTFICHEDQIHIIRKNVKEMPLFEWFENVDDPGWKLEVDNWQKLEKERGWTRKR